MNAKKHFRLEQVLNLRKEVEKARMLEFNEARQEFEGATERLKREETTLDSLAHEFLDKQGQGISVEELQMYADFFQRKTGEIKKQRNEVNSLGERVAEKREDLLEAAKEKKVLETLKGKKLASRQKELAGREQAFLDEIALRKRDPK